jgi:hypothetical protein
MRGRPPARWSSATTGPASWRWGRRSDLVILSRDPTAVPQRAWVRGDDGIGVVATIVGGRLVAGRLDGLA